MAHYLPSTMYRAENNAMQMEGSRAKVQSRERARRGHI